MIDTLPKGAREPKLYEALFSFLTLIVGVGFSIAYLGLDPHIPLFAGVAVACFIGWRCGFGWEDLQDGLVKGITNALPAIIILMVVGILIGLWILAGVVPTFIYYGLQILSPTIFLPAVVIICSLTSIITGTSWGTAGTIGIALIGVGEGLGFPLPLVAGAVLSGAYFGDKMSPLSDTTNLAAGAAGVELFTHIKHMSYTTSVAMGLTLSIETLIGLFYKAQIVEVDKIGPILAALEESFMINPVLLLPMLIVMIVSYRRVPAIPGIVFGIIAGAICAVGLQGATLEELMSVAYGGYTAETSLESVNDLLSRGGLESMYYTIALIMFAMMFGGVMERTHQLAVIAGRILSLAKSRGSLIAATALTGIGSNMVLCDQYMSIVMSGRTYAKAYRERGLAPENLSRAVEDSATVTANLVPWNSGGLYQSSVLGVATLAYLPFNFFCLLSPIVTIVFGYMGWTITPLEEIDASESVENPAIA